MAKLMKQITLSLMGGKHIQRPDVDLFWEERCGNLVRPTNSDENPQCRFKIKLSSKVDDVWSGVFKKLAGQAFPEISEHAPRQISLITFTTQEMLNEKKSEATPQTLEDAGNCNTNLEWRISLDEKSRDTIFADCRLNDAEELFRDLQSLVANTESRASKIEALVQSRVIQLKKRLK